MSRIRWICAIALALALVQNAWSEGEYQKTRDGRTTIWNAQPKSGDEASWSGGRDAEGYAKGFGTLTWYTKRKEGQSKGDLYARYFGNMVRGKLDGPVNVHSKGRTDHAVFVEGVRTTKWTAGTVRSWNTGKAPAESSPQGAVVAEKKPEVTQPEPEAPAEGPPSPAKPKPPINETKAKTAEQVPAPVVQPAAPAPTAAPAPSIVAKKTAPKPAPPKNAAINPKNQAPSLPTKESPTDDGAKPPMDDSLRLLTGPPASIHVEEKPNRAGAWPARLTKEEVIDLADALGLSRGVNLGDFRRDEPEYHEADGTWSIEYLPKKSDLSSDGPSANRFSVTVDDQTSGTVFVPGK